jgi:hypothetical protein
VASVADGPTSEVSAANRRRSSARSQSDDAASRRHRRPRRAQDVARARAHSHGHRPAPRSAGAVSQSSSSSPHTKEDSKAVLSGLRMGVRACLRGPQLAAVRCSVTSASLQAFSCAQLGRSGFGRTLIPRSLVRVQHGSSANPLRTGLLPVPASPDAKAARQDQAAVWGRWRAEKP